MIVITTDEKIKEEQRRLLEEKQYKAQLDKRFDYLERRIWKLEDEIRRMKKGENEATATEIMF